MKTLYLRNKRDWTHIAGNNLIHGAQDRDKFVILVDNIKREVLQEHSYDMKHHPVDTTWHLNLLPTTKATKYLLPSCDIFFRSL